MIVFGGRAFGRRSVTRAECSSVGSVSLQESSREPASPSALEHSKRQSARNQEEDPYQLLNLPVPWSWISQPPELCKINFYGL